MTRSNAREIAVHLIYAAQLSGESADAVLETRLAEENYACLAEENDAYTEAPGKKQRAYIIEAVKGVEAHREELEGYLAQYAVGWNVSRISRLARAIMELAMYEILYRKDVPQNVAVHEALLLAQKYEEPETASFVNGVLGSFVRGRGAGE